MGLRELRNARWRRSGAEMPENREIGGGEGHKSPLERKNDGEFYAHRQGRAALNGLKSEDCSAEPRPKFTKKGGKPSVSGHPGRLTR